jgi:hypothetical protein
MKKIILFLLTFTMLLPYLSFSRSRRWKRTRYELVGGLGTATFMGELGGRGEATHMMGDFNFTSQRALLSAGMRYKLLEPLAVKGIISLGWLSGDDSKCTDIYRLDRNLSFKSHILEIATQLEFSIIKEPVNHRYSLRRRRKFSLKNIKVNTYIFAGISGFWFNPKGLDEGPEGTGEWVSLQPLHTEGQGYIASREPYSRIQMAFPFGIGFKYNLNRKISIGAEFGARYTLTDYIDDVSTSYIDNAWLKRIDPLAARMADKSLLSEYPVKWDHDGNKVLYPAGDQRGDSKYNDFYFFSFVTVAYKLRTGRNGLPKF